MKRYLLPFSLLFWLAACGGNNPGDTGTTGGTSSSPDGGTTGTTGQLTDADNDGVALEDGDCDDGDASVYPGAVEACNGQDDNCDGQVDEGFADTDGDGLPDCLDTEECDGVDNNGDGQVDEGYGDSDADGVADCMDVEECDGLDNNGDGNIDEGFDVDGDGVTSCADVPDCDDEDASRSPLLAEIDGDLIDNNCNGLVDEGYWAYGDLVITEIMANPGDVADPMGEWVELLNVTDRDLYLNGLQLVSDGDDAQIIDSADLLTVAPGDYVVIGNNADFATNGGVVEAYAYADITLSNESDSFAVYAGDLLIDQVQWDNGATMPDPDGASMSLDELYLGAAENDEPDGWCAAYQTWGDGGDYGSPGAANAFCQTTDHDGDGYGIAEGDCDDGDIAISPDATEIWYDGVDQNCDGHSDYDADFDDYDSDAYGGADCDDARVDVNPSQVEVCDDANVDEDCNGVADDDDSGVTDAATLYPDDDGDGYGATGSPVVTCESPTGYGVDDQDCDDHDPTIYPGAPETWYDGVDSNCDELSDYDADEDGFDSDAYGGTDCDDTRSDVNTDQVEICDDLNTDEDCNGAADDADPGTTDAVTYYPDLDEDGFGSDADRFVSCEPLTGWSDAGGDCNDDDATINPDATDTWYDGEDTNCDGWSDYDADRDGFDSDAWTGTDCDDDDGTVHPYAWEDDTDGVDNDCDGYIDTLDPDVPTRVGLTDDSASTITFSAFTFPFCGSDRSSAYVSSNGQITFDSVDTSYTESSTTFVSGQAAVAGWWDDLNPTSGGDVYWMEYDDAVAVWFIDVAEYGTVDANTFSFLFRSDGRIILEYGGMDAVDGLVGWSCGTGSDGASSVDLTAAIADLPTDSAGIGQGTEQAVYELFAGGTTTSGDVADQTFLFCAQAGDDLDGDGWTDTCGDSDDSDPLIYP
ncbi:MAG: hypothetical protein GXP62_06700 [Oligoflexia bacterium]|nr:hypothetical protein [Oligoflexia bacterium]